MTTNNFYYALSLADTLYGINISENSFEEIALIAWNQIGNKRVRLYNYSVCLPECGEKVIDLPCNLDILEAVTGNFEDFQHVSNTYNHGQPGSFTTEQFIEHRKRFTSPYYQSGKYIHYERVGDKLYIKDPVHKVNILYKGVILDENGLPEINDKEALAIATYVAYVTKYKEALITNNNHIFQMANSLKQQWMIQCDQARVTEEISQNEMDEILDAKNCFDRKIFNKSYKPIK